MVVGLPKRVERFWIFVIDETQPVIMLWSMAGNEPYFVAKSPVLIGNASEADTAVCMSSHESPNNKKRSDGVGDGFSAGGAPLRIVSGLMGVSSVVGWSSMGSALSGGE